MTNERQEDRTKPLVWNGIEYLESREEAEKLIASTIEQRVYDLDKPLKDGIRKDLLKSMCLLWETLRDSPNFNTRGRVARYFPRLALYFRNLMKRKISFIDRLFFAHEKINYFILIEECWKNIPNTCLIERCGSPEARVYWNCRGSLSRKNLRKLDKFVAEDNVSELADLYSDRKITEAQYTRLQAIADYAHSLYQGEQAREK